MESNYDKRSVVLLKEWSYSITERRLAVYVCGKWNPRIQ